MTGLDLQRLRCFLAVAEERHFSRAAARLNMTPPPLSRQIKHLEAELGGDLFVRNYHEVDLTPFGAALLPVVRQALAAVDAVSDAAAKLREQGTPLRVAATPFAPSPLIDDFVQLLLSRDVDIDGSIVLDHGSNELSRRLAGGTVDLGLVHLPPPEDSLDWAPWREYPLAVAVRSDDRLASASSLALEDLRGRTLVHPVGRLHSRLLDEHRAALDAAGVTLEDDTSVWIGAAETATTVWSRRLACFVPNLPGTILGRVFSPPDFVVIPLTDGPLMRVGVAWSPTTAAGSRALRHAIDAVRHADG